MAEDEGSACHRLGTQLQMSLLGRKVCILGVDGFCREPAQATDFGRHQLNVLNFAAVFLSLLGRLSFPPRDCCFEPDKTVRFNRLQFIMNSIFLPQYGSCRDNLDVPLSFTGVSVLIELYEEEALTEIHALAQVAREDDTLLGIALLQSLP